MVTESLVGAGWHRVAALRPSLVPGLRIVRQPVRGDVWHVLVEPGSGRQVRLNAPAYELVGRFDGETTMDALWHRQLAWLGEQAPTQDEAMALLAQLFNAGMLRFDAAPHLSLLFARRAGEDRRRRSAMLNPLAMQMPLGDPTRLLDALAPLGPMLFRQAALLAWCLGVLLACVTAAANISELVPDARRLLATPGSYLIAWACYPAIKFLHELGHALAIRRHGGEVREMGVSLLLLTPAPYVDASAANAFASSRTRLVVSAAGILVEVALGCLALLAWAVVAPGAVRDVALVVVLICTISTVLFNANPLVRLDGYHMLADGLELPNLAARSRAWWARRWRALLAGADRGAAPLLAAGETKWLMVYAPASLAWRLLLFFGLVTWVGQHSWMLGWIVLLVLLGWGLRGLWRMVRSSGLEPLLARPRSRRLVLGGLAGAVLALGVLPMPDQVIARAVVWPADNAQLRAGASGFAQGLQVAQDARVRAGQAVLELDDPELGARRERIVAEQTGLLAEQYGALLSEPARAAAIAEDLARNEAELARVERQLADLVVRAQADGEVAWARPQDVPGSFVRRGALLGQVLAGGPGHVRIALLEDDFARVRGHVGAAEVMLLQAPGRVHAARLSLATPGATLELPSAALGDTAGGTVPMDPADPRGLRTRVPVFLLDAEVPDLRATTIGGSAWVKLALPPRPLAAQWLGRARQLLIRQFDPTGQA